MISINHSIVASASSAVVLDAKAINVKAIRPSVQHITANVFGAILRKNSRLTLLKM
jgi:hypothetical protein